MYRYLFLLMNNISVYETKTIWSHLHMGSNGQNKLKNKRETEACIWTDWQLSRVGTGWQKVNEWAKEHMCMTLWHRLQCSGGLREGREGMDEGGLRGKNGDICNIGNSKNKVKKDTWTWMYLHLFKYYFVVFNVTWKFKKCKSHISFVKLIPNHLMWL